MKGRLLVLPLLFICLSSSRAEANMGFWRWWDSLSGPGPFSGIVYELPIVTPYGFRRDQPEQRIRFDPADIDTSPGRLSVRVGLDFAILWAQKNNLPYDPPRAHAPSVLAYPVVPTVDVGRKGIDVGASVGFVRFSSDGASTTHFAYGPRLTLRPGVIFSKTPKRRHELVRIRISALRLQGEMTAEDFGATGAFRGGNEWMWGSTISVNLLALRRDPRESP
jgi:hypothetical protein